MSPPEVRNAAKVSFERSNAYATERRLHGSRREEPSGTMSHLSKILWLLCLISPPCLAGEESGFRVLQPGTALRGAIWLSDGPAALWSSQHSTYLANRVQLGTELAWGQDYQWFVSWIPLDDLSSAESAQPMGSLSRNGMDFAAGYWLVPDRWWIKYTFLIESVRGDSVSGYETAHGHGVAAGLRILDDESFNLSAELAYQYIQPLPFTLVDNNTGASSAASYPSANVLSLSLRVGLDIGGR